LRYLDAVLAIPAPASTGHPEQPVRDITSGTPGGDFMQLVRSLPQGTVISGHSDNSL
jgi:hypothetical protein